METSAARRSRRGNGDVPRPAARSAGEPAHGGSGKVDQTQSFVLLATVGRLKNPGFRSTRIPGRRLRLEVELSEMILLRQHPNRRRPTAFGQLYRVGILAYTERLCGARSVHRSMEKGLCPFDAP